MEQAKFDETLIAFVESHAHIYNKSLKEYRDEKCKENSWLTISLNLDSNPETVKKRWDNLRDRFVRAYREQSLQLPSGSGLQKKIDSTFPYFNIMAWLIPHIRKRKTTTSVINPIKTARVCETTGDSQESSTQECELQTDEPVIIEGVEREIDQELFAPESSILSPESSSGIISPSPGLLRKTNLQNNLTKALSSLHQYMDKNTNKSNTKNDSDTMFMQSIVQDMQLIRSNKEKLKFKKEVLDLLEKYISD